MRKGALAAAILVAAFAAGAWWFVARSEADGDAARRRTPAATTREALAPAESAESAAAVDATRTENRDAAVAAPEAVRAVVAGRAGSSNWDQTAKTSGIELDVLDATTRERLHDVTIEQGGEYDESAASREPPDGGPHALEIAADRERAVVAHGDAPLRIQLPPRMRRGRIRYLIGAPGHATVARWFDVSISGWRRHVVALSAGGSLAVVVHGDGEEVKGRVEVFEFAAIARLCFAMGGEVHTFDALFTDLMRDPELTARKLRDFSSGASVGFELTSAARVSETRLDGVPEGAWLGLLTFGADFMARRHVVTGATVGLGEASARLEFDLSAAPQVVYARFAGTLRFASGWTAAEVAAVHRCDFIALDADHSIAPLDRFITGAEPTDDDHRLSFDARWQRAGRHAMTLEGIPVVLAADVDGTTTDPEGKGAVDASPPLDLFVDAPASVTLRVRDRSGAPRETVLLRYLAGPADLRFDLSAHRIATPADGLARLLRAPRGPFHVETEPRASVAFVERDVELVAGENLLDVVVGDYAGVRLALRDVDVPLPFTFGTEIVVTRAGAPRDPIDVRRRTTWLGAECQIDLEAPCRYVVSVRGVPGFEDPAPVEFAVEPGKVPRVEIVLTTPR